jgi:putative membrane protein
MKSKLLFLLTIVSTFFVSSTFAAEANKALEVTPASTQSSDKTNPTGNPTDSKVDKAQAKKDGEVIGWLIVVDDNEINAAKEAAKKQNTDPMVKEYVNMLEKDHTNNLKDTVALSKKTGIEAVTDKESSKLEHDGEELLTKLKPLDNPKFQEEFIAAMVKGHQGALDKLNQEINTVQNPELKKHLEATRTVVEHHLQKAKEIQAQLKAKPNA